METLRFLFGNNAKGVGQSGQIAWENSRIRRNRGPRLRRPCQKALLREGKFLNNKG